MKKSSRFNNRNTKTDFFTIKTGIPEFGTYFVVFSIVGKTYATIPKTDTGLQKKHKRIPSNFMWRGIIMPKYPYIKLYLSVSNIYTALSINIPFLEQDLIFVSKNLWFYSLMNVLLNSYHVTAISLFESQSVGCLS